MNDELARRFPDMKSITAPPGLSTINGIGTTVVGRRDYDPETGTYVKTYVFCVLFIPIFTLAAYRVADAGQGWYFLGKVPLSRFARFWNSGVVLLIAGLAGWIAWTSHTHTPEYQAGRKLAEADGLAATGEQGRAAEVYRDVIVGRSAKSEEARQKLTALLDDPGLRPDQAAGVYRVGLELARQDATPVPDLYDRAVRQAKRWAADDPRGTLAVLELVGPLSPRPDELLALRRDLLEKLAAANPTDPELASRLAVVYEAAGEREKCEKLLAPHEARLGSLDGAAVLGRIYSGQGKLDRAAALLQPYVDAKLPALRSAEARLKSAADAADHRVLAELRSGKAAGFDYAAYDRSAKPQQQAMVRDYADTALKNDPGLRDARQAMIESAGVVPAALDLGLVRLQLGQGSADPAARDRELRAAEQSFLAVRGFAQESDTYRLSLGQVYYWLGKHADGKKQFDELIQARGRTTELLLLVSNMLREVGATSEARAMAEEAYNTATDPQKKYQAASQRALLHTDLDDDILWLTRADPDEPFIKASLAYTRGHKAAREGKTAEAAAQLRDAVALYAKQPEGPGTLNNAALCHFELHRLTGEAAEFARGVDKLDRAIALKPSDSILLYNAAAVVLDGAIRDAVGGAIDLSVLKRQADWDVLAFAYDGPAAARRSPTGCGCTRGSSRHADTWKSC
jgi:predicted Zn-dependent protease